MICKKGCTFSDSSVGCGSCKEKGVEFNDRLLYLVDEDTNYGICKHCNKVRKIDETFVCGDCSADSLCLVKWNKGFRP